MRYNSTIADYLKSSKRNRDKTEAEKIYIEIIRTNDIFLATTIASIINLIELLLIEYQTYNEPEVLQEIHEYLDLFNKKTRNEFSFAGEIIQSLLFQAKLAEIEGEFEKAETHLDEALIMSKGNDLPLLVIKVKDEKNRMAKGFEEMKLLIANNTSFSERMEKINLMDYVKRAQGIITPLDSGGIISETENID